MMRWFPRNDEDATAEQLLAKAARAYGLAPEQIVASRVDAHTGQVILVTAGAIKVRFRRGQSVTPLTPGQRGELRECARHGRFGADAVACPACVAEADPKRTPAVRSRRKGE